LITRKYSGRNICSSSVESMVVEAMDRAIRQLTDNPGPVALNDYAFPARTAQQIKDTPAPSPMTSIPEEPADAGTSSGHGDDPVSWML
jgi:hypothetical protein